MQYHEAGSFSTAWDIYWFEKNLQGDIVAIYNASGTKLITYTYDAWGNTTVAYYNGGNYTSAVNNRFTYRGYYYDYDLGLYYLQSRYYDSVTCRFISADSYINANGDIVGFNMYAYCSNNPVMYYDPTGRSVIGVIALTLLIGLVVFSLTGSEATVNLAEIDKPVDMKKPPPPESGYKPPKKNPNPEKVKNPNGSGNGWPDNEGGVWVPDNNQDGGPGWVQQFPGGKHKHRYPDGHVRSHEFSFDEKILVGGIFIVGAGIMMVILVANDATGVGVVDDVAIPVVVDVFMKGVQLVGG